MGDILSNYVLYPLVLKITDSYYLYSLILPYIATLGEFVDKDVLSWSFYRGIVKLLSSIRLVNNLEKKIK